MEADCANHGNHNGKCVIMTFMQDGFGLCSCATYDTLVYHLNFSMKP